MPYSIHTESSPTVKDVGVWIMGHNPFRRHMVAARSEEEAVNWFAREQYVDPTAVWGQGVRRVADLNDTKVAVDREGRHPVALRILVDLHLSMGDPVPCILAAEVPLPQPTVKEG